MEPVINAGDDELDAGGDPEAAPSRWTLFVAWLVRPLVPLANRAARLRYEVEVTRLEIELAKEKRNRLRAALDADAAKQKAETLALMHAHVVAMIKSEIAIHGAATKAATDR